MSLFFQHHIADGQLGKAIGGDLYWSRNEVKIGKKIQSYERLWGIFSAGILLIGKYKTWHLGGAYMYEQHLVAKGAR